MSRNPYQQTADFGPSLSVPAERTSTLAIISLVLSLICFVPGLPTLGSLLGVFALIGISSSQGRIKGTGLALAGIILGLLFSMAQIGLALGGNILVNQYASIAAAPLASAEAGDSAALRAALAPETAAVLTDEDIAAFKAAYTAEAGAYDKSIRGILPVFSALAAMGPTIDQSLQSQRLMPVPAKFDQGIHGVWVDPLSDASGNPTQWPPIVKNMGIARADKSVIWLIDPDELKARLAAAAANPSSPDAPADDTPAQSESPR
jgi:hypothetical protein